MGDGHRSFRVGTHGQAGNPEVGGFLLYPPGVRNHKTAIENQIHESHIIQGFQQSYPFGVFHKRHQAVLFKVLPGPGVNGKNKGDLPGNT